MAADVTSSPTEVLRNPETTLHSSSEIRDAIEKPALKYRREIIWPNVVMHIYLNVAALYGAYLMLTSAKTLTGIWAFILHQAGVLGTTAGAHRLWAHRAYKATWQLRLILMLLHTTAFQFSIYEWVRYHRVHHKNSDTDADPHNVHRGFFFSHYGWILVRKHPAVKEKGKLIDYSDIVTDPLLMFQKRYYKILLLIFCFLIPTAVPVYLWGETWTNAYNIAAVLRQMVTLHVILFLNSITHWPDTWRKRPYDKNIFPSENFMVSLLTLGEGWHNFHHVFPWDYKTAEIGGSRINLTTCFIDFCARIGWAYDLKTVPMSVVKKRKERTGDGTHEIWGWGDKDMTTSDKNLMLVFNKKVM